MSNVKIVVSCFALCYLLFAILFSCSYRLFPPLIATTAVSYIHSRPVFKIHLSQVSLKRNTSNSGIRSLKCYAGKVGAAFKSAHSSTPWKSTNALNAGGYGYAGKAGAISKSGILDACNAVRYSYTGKFGATVKSLLPNTGNAVPYGYAGKAGAIYKSHFSNAGNAVRYVYAGKAGALVKSQIPNAGNAVSYG